MNFSYFIARRYLFSKRKANFINIISILSVVGIAITTAALVIVLSVFNGLGDLLRSLNNSFDPEIKIQATAGKSFVVSDALLSKVKGVEGVEIVSEVIEDYAYVRYRDANQVITMKGVSDNFLAQNRIPKENIVEGELKLREGEVNYATVGQGIRYMLSIAINEPMYPLQFFYINDVKAGVLDPSKLYTRKNILPGGAFSIVQTLDENYIIVPLVFAQDLLSYGNKRTSLEVKTKTSANVFDVERKIQDAIGKDFNVLNNEEQHKDLYKLLRMEKLFAFLALTMILIIGSINVFFSLMMLALDKKKDISILSSMGASGKQIRNIFIAEGALIGMLGAIAGLVLGAITCYIQMRFGIVSMGMETSITQGYPVQMRWPDFVVVLGVVSVVTFLISLHPSRLAAGIPAVRHL